MIKTTVIGDRHLFSTDHLHIKTAPKSRPRCRPTHIVLAQQQRKQILILDATNVLCRAAADAKRERATTRALFADWLHFLKHTVPNALPIAVFDSTGSPRWRTAVDPNYMQRRKKRLDNNNDSTTTQTANSNNNSNQSPFLTVSKDQGCIPIVATKGYEADDVISALCQHLITDTSNSITIASGDADMQQNLSATVNWLKILNQPSIKHTAALELITAESFKQLHGGLSPHLYGDLLAMTGKKETGIGGIGISSNTATRLLITYNGLDQVIQAAAKGKLKGWGPKVVAALSNPLILQQLERNRKVLQHKADPSILQDRDVQLIEKQLLLVQDNNNELLDPTSKEPIGWKHPLHARRWRRATELVSNLFEFKLENQNIITRVSFMDTTPNGLPIDVLLFADATAMTAVFLCGPEQFSQQPLKDPSSTIESQVESYLQGNEGYSKALLKQLNGAMQHHTSLVRKSCNYKILVVAI